MGEFSARASATKSPAPRPTVGVLRRSCACAAGEKCEECGGVRRAAAGPAAPAVAPPAVHDVLRSPGQPLDPVTRTAMERRFGHHFGRVAVGPPRPHDALTVGPTGDRWEAEAERVAARVADGPEPAAGTAADFGGIRVHTGPAAAAAAAAVGAKAFAVGPAVVFGAGEFAPDTPAGRSLLAHELAHTLQPHAAARLARSCADALNGTPTPSGDSVLTGRAGVNFGTVPVTPDVSVAPLAGTVRLKVHLPRSLQQALAGGGLLGQLLGGATVNFDIEAAMGGTALPPRYAGNELCVFVTFRRDPGSANWFLDFRLLAGSRFDVPLQVGLGTPVLPAPSSATGTGHVVLQLTEDLTGSVGPVAVESTGDIGQTWARIRDQVRDVLALRVRNINVPMDLRARAGLTLPFPIPGRDPAQASLLPVEILGDLRLRTRASSAGGRFNLLLEGSALGSAGMGAVALQLDGWGQLSGPVPEEVRLGDLTDRRLLDDLLGRSTGGGEVVGRLTAFGLPGRVDARFTLGEGHVTGTGSFLSPVGVGGGRFDYTLGGGLSADLGMLGLTRLVIAPTDRRPEPPSGPPAFDFGTSVTGVGVTGVRVQPSGTQVFSAGVGPQFITTPENRTEVGVYGGVHYLVEF